MGAQVSIEVKEIRRDELVSVQQDIQSRFAKSKVGQVVRVLVDGLDEDGNLVGRTQWDAPDVDPLVFLSPSPDPSVPPLAKGQIRNCLVDGTCLYDLEAHPID